ncbi:NAD(P)H azoreductase [Lachnellula arida]|uniref:NAD(P)H azoreductase n=1 Tax=Lachnellula arida TaxID=1316785 RepID=A0A8T9B6P4_9HELO|nr:NAD(P)H azoreductase [Lachnellula arida]
MATGVTRVFMYASAKAPLLDLFTAAKNGGVKHIVLLLSMSVEIDPDGLLGKMHSNEEAAIREAGFSYTFIRPRNFASNSRQFWAPSIQKTGKVWITYPNAQSAPVSEEDMAAVALVALTTDKLLNQAVEAISHLRERDENKSVELIVLTAEEWKAYMIQHMPAEFVDQLIIEVGGWKADLSVEEKTCGINAPNLACLFRRFFPPRRGRR